MHSDDPTEMSIDERLEELAALLAGGFLRLKRRTGCLPPATSESDESSKIPSDSAWQPPETSALCPPR